LCTLGEEEGGQHDEQFYYEASRDEQYEDEEPTGPQPTILMSQVHATLSAKIIALTLLYLQLT